MREIPKNNSEKQESFDKVKLEEFDMDYFKSLEGEDGWIALGIDGYKNQRYFMACAEDGEKIGIVGVYDAGDDKNITHTVIDPKYRGQGLAAKCKNAIMEKLNLSSITMTISLDNKSSIKAAEKLPGVKRVSDDKFETDFHKAKYIYTRPEKNKTKSN